MCFRCELYDSFLLLQRSPARCRLGPLSTARAHSFVRFTQNVHSSAARQDTVAAALGPNHRTMRIVVRVWTLKAVEELRYTHEAQIQSV